MSKQPTLTQVLPPRLMVVLVAFGIIVVTLAAFSQFSQQAQQTEDAFFVQTERLLMQQKTLGKQLRTALHGLTSVHQNTHELNRYNQILFGESQLKQVPQVSMFGIAPRVNPESLLSFVQSMHKSGFESFQVRCARLSNGHCAPSPLEHFPTQLVIPFTPRNARHLGEDLYTVPGFKKALHQAQSHQKSAGLLVIPSEKNPWIPPGELVIQPFYAPVLESSASRPDLYRILGVAFAWILPQKILQSMSEQVQSESAIQITLAPAANPQHSWQIQTPLFKQSETSKSRLDTLLNRGFSIERQTRLLIHGVPWELYFKRHLTLQDFKLVPLISTSGVSLLAYLLIVTLLFRVRARGILLRNENEHIRHLAYYDPVTGLPNKLNFINHLDRQIHQHSARVHVLVLEIYKFKKIREIRGHETGDRILKGVANYLQHTLSQYDNTLLARLEGAEFALCMVDCDPSQIGKIAKEMIKSIDQYTVSVNDNLPFSANIGISRHPEDGARTGLLIRHATAALSSAQQQGPGHTLHFYAELETSLLQQTAIESHLHCALQNNEFSLVYQPQYNLKTGHIDAAEALLRWHNPELGQVPPDQFIPILEQNQDINAIGDWVIKSSIRQLCEWRRNGLPIERVAINISAVQLSQPRFIEKVHRLMQRADLPGHSIELELTERAVMLDAESNIELFNRLSQAGYSLSVDDFGTGYSSLSYLKAFPLNILKIDKSFVDGLPHEAHDVALTEAIIQLAHNLDMQVIAEGVENREQVMHLAEAGCEKIQGYWLSRPLAPEELESWLAQFQQRYLHFAEALP